jgi:Glucose-6-phosphate dehydrogenase, NAD binding domain
MRPPGGEALDEGVFGRLAARLSYLSGDLDDGATYEAVAAAIGDARDPVFYLELPPALFGVVIKGLHDAGLTESCRVVVEKPFGHDLASARDLNQEIHRYLAEAPRRRRDDPARYRPAVRGQRRDQRATSSSCSYSRGCSSSASRAAGGLWPSEPCGRL